MKKTTLIAFAMAMLPIMHVYGLSGSKYYAELKTTVKSGSGKVYAATTSTSNPAYTSSPSSAKGSYTSTSGGDVSGFYAYAKPDYGYKFEKWTNTSGNQLSTSANYGPITLKASKTSGETLTTEYWAYFEEKTHYTVNLAVPTVSAGFASYSVTGDNGYTAKTFLSAGSLTAYDDETYTFTCNLKNTDIYELAGWDVGGVVTETSTLSKKFAAAATVKAVLREKQKYAVTLEEPTLSAGFVSYSVTGTGVDSSSLASGGILQAYYDGTYTFSCTLTDDTYEFVKWVVTDSSGTTEYPESTLSKQFSSAATVQAVLNQKAQYDLTLAKPEGVTSYTVTGASGLSNGGTVTLHGATTCTFACTIDDDYKFVKWTVTDESGTTDHTENTLTQTFASSDVTVTAVVVPKETYELTLVQPAGVESYTVTKAGNPVGFSNGKATVREFDTYTFECAIDTVQYSFVKWTITDSSGTTEITDATFTRTFTSATTVTAVLHKKAVYELTFVLPENVDSFAITGPNGEVVISDGKATVYELDSYTIDCAYDDDNYEIVKWTVTDSNGTLEPASEQVTRTFTSDATVTVTMAKIEAYIATCPAVPSGCSYKVGSETVTTEEKKVKGAKGQPLTVTLSAATAGSGYLFAGWYIENADGSKTYISKASSITQTFESNVTIGADFVSSSSSKAALVVKASGGYGEYDDLATAFSALETGDSIAICNSATLSASVAVPQGVTLTVPSGVTLTVASGQTLYVDGTVSNSGTISGTVSKCTKLIKQTGDGTDASGKPKPFNPYGSVKYWKTAITSPSITISGVSAGSHTTILNGYGEAFRTTDVTSSSTFIHVSVDTSKAVNHITGINSVSTVKNILTDTIKDGMAVFLSSSCVINGGTSSKTTFTGRMDCAGQTLSSVSGVEVSNGGASHLLNCPSFTMKKSVGNNFSFYNCKSITFSTFNAKGSVVLNFYDCGTYDDKASYSATFASGASPNGAATFSFYSGFFESLTFKTGVKIYGGYYKSNPTSYLATGLNLAAKQESAYGNYYHVYADIPEKVAQIGSAQYETLQAAVNAATSGQTIKLLKNYDANDSITIASEKSLIIDLNGYAIAGDSGTITNNGTLRIGDCSGGNGSCSYAIVNNGTMDVTYGAYSGDITLNSGMLTTHNGTFTGSFEFGDGVANTSDVLTIHGGMFKKSVKSLLVGDYCEVTYNGLYYVGAFPYAILSSASISGAEKAWSLTAVTSADRELYLKTSKVRTSFSSDSDWDRYAELDSALTPYKGYIIDCVISFDRPVAKGSVTAYATAKVTANDTLDKSLEANESYRVLSPKVAAAGYYQIDFYRFITGSDCPTTLSAGIADRNSANTGTIATIELELCHSNRTTHVLNKDYAIATCRYMLGGKKAAIDRAGSRLAYNSLEDAVAAAQEGETIILGADRTGNITVGKACTIDVNGFAFNGSVTVADGFELDDSVAGLFIVTAAVVDPVARVDVETVVSQVVTDEWLEANNISNEAEPEAIQAAVEAVLKQTDDNGNEKWQNLVLGQEADKPVEVKASAGGTTSNVTVAVSFEVPKDESTGEKIETGYTVKYAFDQVTDSTGATVENAGKAKEEPTLDFTSVNAEDGPTYFKMRAVLESKDGNVTTNVPVEKTIGVLKVESDAAVTIIPVPWQSLGDGVDGKVTASELVHAASLTDGDQLIVYGSDGKATSWVVENGAWTSPDESTLGDGPAQHNDSVDPSTVGIARGQGVVLIRQDTEKDIVLIGQPADEEAPVVTPIADAVDDEPSWNLVASPKLEDVDVNEKFATLANETEPDTADKIMIPTAGAPRNCTFDGTTWGYSGSRKIQVIIKGVSTDVWIPARVTENVKVPAGTGFWYINSSKDKDKKLSW